MNVIVGTLLVLVGMFVGSFLTSAAATARVARERVEMAESLLGVLSRFATMLEGMGVPAQDIAVLRAREDTLRKLIDQVKPR